MPRMDNSNPDVLIDFNMTFDPDNPGATNPIDLCIECAWDYQAMGVESNVEHPPYEDGDYICLACGVRLIEEDD